MRLKIAFALLLSALALPALGQTPAVAQPTPLTRLPVPGQPVATGLSGWLSDIRALIKNGNNDIAAMSIIDKAQKGDHSGIPQLYELAKSNNPIALTALGYALDNGVWGVSMNAMQARQFTERGALSEDIGKYNLAVMMYYGRGGSQDRAKAQEIWAALADRRVNGYACARAAIGAIPKNQGESLPSAFRDYAQCAADSNIPIGLYLMGQWELKAGNPQAAIGWFERSVDAGDNNGFAPLSAAYYDGKGVSQNKVQAATWWLINVYRNGKAGNNLSAGNLTRFGLTDAERQQAVTWAQQWLNAHKPIAQFNYSKTVLNVVTPGAGRRGLGGRQ